MNVPSPSSPHPARPSADRPAADIAAAKQAERTRLRAARRAIRPEERERQSRAAVEHLWAWLGPRVRARVAAGDAPVVGTVLSMPSEPDTAGLRRRLIDAGADVFVPVIEPERRLSWVRWRPDAPTRRARLAPVEEPIGPRHGLDILADAAALVMPGLAVTDDGARLGQGGGYYDRVLAALPPSVPTVAVLFEDELLPAGSLPLEPTDRPVDAVATAAGLHMCGRPLPGSR